MQLVFDFGVTAPIPIFERTHPEVAANNCREVARMSSAVDLKSNMDLSMLVLRKVSNGVVNFSDVSWVVKCRAKFLAPSHFGLESSPSVH